MRNENTRTRSFGNSLLLAKGGLGPAGRVARVVADRGGAAAWSDVDVGPAGANVPLVESRFAGGVDLGRRGGEEL